LERFNTVACPSTQEPFAPDARKSMDRLTVSKNWLSKPPSRIAVNGICMSRKVHSHPPWQTPTGLQCADETQNPKVESESRK
jgi:hypothetical protein